jgi:hypothetical protein
VTEVQEIEIEQLMARIRENLRQRSGDEQITA